MKSLSWMDPIEEIGLAAERFNVEEVSLVAVAKPLAGRAAFLEATCADSQLRTRVEALLGHPGQAIFDYYRSRLKEQR